MPPSLFRLIDDWQGRGVGTLLLEMLSGRARAEGITTFTALMLATNREMMELFEQLDPMRIVDQATGTVEIEVPIPRSAWRPRSGSCFGSRPNTT
ncbi:MAG: N-acetyltransferase family protein [Solirubrobacteraceae bacterium]